MHILFLSSLCVLVFIADSFAVTVQPQRSKTLSKHPVILVVSFDGFRYDYFNKAKATPWLSALRTSGVSVPYMEPTFPTKTFPNHQSIATGVYSETHGIVDNMVFDPKFNKTLSGYTNDPGFWNYHPDVLPIWILNEMAGDERYSGCMMWPGSSQPYGANNKSRPTYYYPGYNGSVLWEERVDTVLSWITNKKRPANLVFLYFEEPDSHGHSFGPNSEETLVEVEKADNRTAYLISKLIEAGIYNQINLILLSDHGMKEVTQQRIIYLETLVDMDDLVKDKYGFTPVLQLVPNIEKEEELHNVLTDLADQYSFSFWRKKDLINPFYYQSSRRITDFVLIADPGYAFDDFNKSISNYNKKLGVIANETREYGVHGYSNVAASMRPFFMAHGPVFRKSFEHPPIKNVDVFPLISAILGIPEVPSNGSLSRVVEMIEPSFLSDVATGITISHPLQLLAITTLIKMIY